ncbi:MAG: T9SS type A sorting domain-containing protein [Owenweeksia sp.]|nr:T9SS type A sorting domain-containing protein [Owenweeksia sp.]
MPQPHKGKFTVDLAEVRPWVELKIVDVTGKVVYRNYFSQSQNIDLQLDQPKGLYFLEIKSGKDCE